MKKKFNLKEQYLKCWKHISSSKQFIFLIIEVFVLFVILGFIIPLPEVLHQEVVEYLMEIISETDGLGAFGLMRYIFFNNLASSFFGMVFGIALGFVPVLTTLFNGFVLGFVAEMAVSSNGVVSLWRLFPHGIFELPAIFISLGLGLRLGLSIFDKKKDAVKNNLIESIRVFLFVIFPLLFVAAIIEGLLIFLGI